MVKARTNSLHERLPVEIRGQVESDLVDQPPGRETYEKVYEHYQLDVHGISFSALARYGGYLRTLKRNEWIRQVGNDLMAEMDLKPSIEGAIRARLYETLHSADQTSLGDLLKAALTEKSLREATIRTEEWEAKKAAALKALKASEGGEKDDPAKALDKLREDIKSIYGIN